MATSQEIANAYIALTVKAPNIKRDIETELRKADGIDAGEKVGTDLGRGISNKQAAIAGAVGGVFAQIANVAGTALGDLFSQAVEASDATQKFEKTLGFANLDTSAIDTAMSRAREYADNTVYDLGTIQNTTAQLAANGIDNYSELTEAAGNLNAVAGGNEDTFSSVAQMLSQTAGAGKLTTENWNQLADAIPGASGRLQEALSDAGAYTGNFRDAMAEGQITADEFNTALLELGTEPVAVEAATSVETMEGSVGNLSAAIVGKLSDAFTAVKPFITGFTSAIADFIGSSELFVPVLAGVGTALLVLLAPALWAAVTATWAFTTALLANPFTWIVLGIGALVAAIVWVATQTTFFQDTWTFVTEAIGNAATWLWENVLSPVFTAIGDIFTWLYENVIAPIGQLVVNYFRFWGAIATWLWENVISPVFAAIGQVFQWIWTTIIQPIIGFITGAINGLGLIFTWLYENAIRPAWEGISSAIGGAWTWIRDNVFAPFGTAIDTIGKTFENVAKFIATAWDGIKKAAAEPINFILGTVWNEGLLGFWNPLVRELGLADMQLPKADLIEFANGGVENHVAQIARGGAMRLWAEPETGGEAYIPLSPAKRGRSTAILADVAQRFGFGLTQFADGGILGGVGDFFGDVWDNVQNWASVAWEFISDPAKAIQTHVIDGIINPLASGQNMFGRTVAGFASNTLKSMTDMFASAAPSGPAGKGMGWEAMWRIVQSAVPGAIKTSDFRGGSRTVNGGQSYHALGRAIDLIPASMATFNAVAKLFPNASELIYSPAGRRQLLNGQPFDGWSDAVRRQHYNHVHLAMAGGGVIPKLYDEGGWLPHGGMALNLSGRPEPVFTGEQWDTLRQGGGMPKELVVVDADGALIGRMRVEAEASIRTAQRSTVVKLSGGEVSA